MPVSGGASAQKVHKISHNHKTATIHAIATKL